MIQKLHSVFIKDGNIITGGFDKLKARNCTISAGILRAHSQSPDVPLAVGDAIKLRFDSLTSHDITYVNIIQTARASGMTEFPLPYVLTNCHNSLCAVGGTINEDDHAFALSAARKYGGVYIPANLAVIHSYNREMMTGCGRMILGSDSHTRYGALGAMGIGEGGGELVKQLLCRTYDILAPEVVAVVLSGKPKAGVGPQDVALAIIKEVFSDGFVKNRVMEFIGEGISGLPVEYRNAIDVMTTETACLSSIWQTDEAVKAYYRAHGREYDYHALAPADTAYYERALLIDLSEIEPMIALPFHPSNAYTIREFKQNARDILMSDARLTPLTSKLGRNGLQAEQGVIAGCAGGTFDSLCAAASILDGHGIGNGAFSMSAYAGSMPAYLALMRAGAIDKLLSAGVIMRECFCGACFGAGDTPANGTLSLRHVTRNFMNREGAKPGEGQSAYVALMDSRSIAATARNGGVLTGADELEYFESIPEYHFDASVYEKRVFKAKAPDASVPLTMAPSIKDWGEFPALNKHLLVKIVSYIDDPVTTTDELIPSGETASFRSNPMRLAEFTLSRRDPEYVKRAKAFPGNGEVESVLKALAGEYDISDVSAGSAIYANMLGDGSAREQAASCQRVLGGSANFAREYATKRYRSNLINWGLIPFQTSDGDKLSLNDYVFVPDIREAINSGMESVKAFAVTGAGVIGLTLNIGTLTKEERSILVKGCLINYYRGE